VSRNAAGDKKDAKTPQVDVSKLSDFEISVLIIDRDTAQFRMNAIDELLAKVGEAKGFTEAAKKELNALYKGSRLLARVVEESNRLTILPVQTLQIKVDVQPIKNFLEPRILQPLKQKHGINYRLEAKEGFLYAIVLEGQVDAKMKDELTAPVLWALEKASEKTTQKQ